MKIIGVITQLLIRPFIEVITPLIRIVCEDLYTVSLIIQELLGRKPEIVSADHPAI